jgi:hypothetical protein
MSISTVTMARGPPRHCHQTGWMGVVAKMIQLYGFLDPEKALQEGKTRRSFAVVQKSEKGHEAMAESSARCLPVPA